VPKTARLPLLLAAPERAVPARKWPRRPATGDLTRLRGLQNGHVPIDLPLCRTTAGQHGQVLKVLDGTARPETEVDRRVFPVKKAGLQGHCRCRKLARRAIAAGIPRGDTTPRGTGVAVAARNCRAMPSTRARDSSTAVGREERK
jgi:hypothetical protein